MSHYPCMFNVSAILIHDTLQTTFPLSDAVINEAPWQCTSLPYNRLFQLINGVELSAVVYSLLYGPKWRNPFNLNLGCWGPAWRNEGDILTPQVQVGYTR